MVKFGLKATGVAMLILLGASAAQAGSLEKILGVKGVIFSQKAGTDQTAKSSVVSMRFEQIQSESSEGKNHENSVYFKVSVTFRGDQKELSASGSCTKDEEQLDCRIECDGSGFFLQSAGKKSLLLLNPEGFSVNACNEDSGKARTVMPSRENSVYQLDSGKKS